MIQKPLRPVPPRSVIATVVVLLWAMSTVSRPPPRSTVVARAPATDEPTAEPTPLPTATAPAGCQPGSPEADLQPGRTELTVGQRAILRVDYRNISGPCATVRVSSEAVVRYVPDPSRGRRDCSYSTFFCLEGMTTGTAEVFVEAGGESFYWDGARCVFIDAYARSNTVSVVVNGPPVLLPWMAAGPEDGR